MKNDFAKIKLSDFIRENLEKRGWAGLDLCTMLGGVPKSVGSKIANGKQAPTFRQIVALANMFDVGIKDILNMRLYEEVCQTGKMMGLSEDEQKLIEIFKKVPVGELISRHWVGVKNRNDTKEMVRVFTPYLEEAKSSSALAHKTHAEDIQLSNLQKAWLLRVRSLARSMTPSGDFDHTNLSSVIADLKSVMVEQKSLSEVVSILDRAGIRLVLVECKKSKIDAVCTWLDENSPVIGMTLRFDRIDNFWFVLRHELSHVEQGFDVNPKIDEDIGSETIDSLESVANAAAQEFCAPKKIVDRYLEQSQGKIIDEDVKEFASKNGILPAAMAGQIRFRLSKYNILNRLIGKFREDLLRSATVKDGWGYVSA